MCVVEESTFYRGVVILCCLHLHRVIVVLLKIVIKAQRSRDILIVRRWIKDFFSHKDYFTETFFSYCKETHNDYDALDINQYKGNYR